CIGEHNDRVLAAHFQREPVPVGSSGGTILTAYFARTGQGNEAHTFVDDQAVAEFTDESRDYVQYAGREACITEQFAQFEADDWRHFGRLQNYSVTGSQCETDLANAEQQREVEWSDGDNYTERATHAVGLNARIVGNVGFAF